MAHVAGYVIVNEFSLPEDSYYRPAVKAKCRDGFCPFGPQLVPAQEIADPHALELKLYVNGELRQRNNTANLVRDIPRLIAEISEFMTHAGDVLITGTPKSASTCIPATASRSRSTASAASPTTSSRNEEPTMKHARIRYQGQVHQVTVEDANAVRLADGTLLAEDRVEWLPPATGSMFALGLNYADHAAELSFKAPSEPLAFIKSPGTYTGHRQVSWRPDNVDYMHYECELVAVIGKPARNVRREDALGYLAGYTVCNDYAIRDYLENYYRPNLRVKNRDATTPVGPWIVDAAEVPEPNRLTLRTWVNGELRQEGSTADMIFDIPYLIGILLQLHDPAAGRHDRHRHPGRPVRRGPRRRSGGGGGRRRSPGQPNRQRGRILPRPRTGARRMIKHWINGREVESKDVFENYNPATGELIGEVASGGAAEIDAAVAAAREAFPKWANTPAKERARLMRRLGELIDRNVPHLAELETLDTGLPIHQTKNVLIPRASHNFEFFAEVCTRMNGHSYPVDDQMLNYTCTSR